MKKLQPEILQSVGMAIDDNERRQVLSVVIAARNEEKNIGRTLESLLLEKCIAEIIVVDDHSEDGTSEIVKKKAFGDDRIKLIMAPDLPDGWTGKVHALYVGCKVATGDYLLFTDADVIFSGNIISVVAELMQREGLDHVGGMFGLKCTNVSEKIAAPVLAAIGYFSMVISSERFGAGTGAFNMVRRTSYLNAGGHVAIFDQIVDDVALARLMKKKSSKTLFLRETSPFVQVRLFEGWQGYWNAIARSSIPFLNMRNSITGLIAFFFVFVAAGVLISPLLGLYFLWDAIITNHMFSWMTGSLFWTFYLVFYFFIFVQKNHCDTKWYWVLFYPIAFMVMVISVLKTSICMVTKPSLVWRGRHYKLVI